MAAFDFTQGFDPSSIVETFGHMSDSARTRAMNALSMTSFDTLNIFNKYPTVTTKVMVGAIASLAAKASAGALSSTTGFIRSLLGANGNTPEEGAVGQEAAFRALEEYATTGKPDTSNPSLNKIVSTQEGAKIIADLYGAYRTNPVFSPAGESFINNIAPGVSTADAAEALFHTNEQAAYTAHTTIGTDPPPFETPTAAAAGIDAAATAANGGNPSLMSEMGINTDITGTDPHDQAVSNLFKMAIMERDASKRNEMIAMINAGKKYEDNAKIENSPDSFLAHYQQLRQDLARRPINVKSQRAMASQGLVQQVYYSNRVQQ